MSTTYPVPGQEGEYPAPRYPDVRLRVVPNERVLREADDHLGELVQQLYEQVRDEGLSIELDTSDRTRPGEARGGADGGIVLQLVLLQAFADAVVGQILDAGLDWLGRYFRRTREDRPKVIIYGPDGDVLREVELED